MSIPDFQTIMGPLLRATADGRDYRVRELIDLLADEFNLSEEERKELLPSGVQATFDNRATWAAASFIFQYPERVKYDSPGPGSPPRRTTPPWVTVHFGSSPVGTVETVSMDTNL